MTVTIYTEDQQATIQGGSSRITRVGEVTHKKLVYFIWKPTARMSSFQVTLDRGYMRFPIKEREEVMRKWHVAVLKNKARISKLAEKERAAARAAKRAEKAGA